MVEGLTSFINSLSEDEQIDLVTWRGWGGMITRPATGQWCVRKPNVRITERTAEYLLGMPLVGDFLEEALWMLGSSCEDYEIERLSRPGRGVEPHGTIMAQDRGWQAVRDHEKKKR